MNKKAILKAIKDAGHTHVVVEYSGGQGHGGVDYVYGLNSSGGKYSLCKCPVIREEWDRQKKKKIKVAKVKEGSGPSATYRDATPEEIAEQDLFNIITAPIFEEWGNFEGEAIVKGSYSFDLANDKITKDQDVRELQGSQESEEW